jgi:hypothetical protein
MTLKALRDELAKRKVRGPCGDHHGRQLIQTGTLGFGAFSDSLLRSFVSRLPEKPDLH